MIARVADHCTWLGRYLERADATARALAGTYSLALDGELTAYQCWLPMVIVAGEEREFATVHQLLTHVVDTTHEIFDTLATDLFGYPDGPQHKEAPV